MEMSVPGDRGQKKTDGDAGDGHAIRMTEASEEGWCQLERTGAEAARASSSLAIRVKYS